MKKDKILKALTGSGIPGEVLLDVPYITMSGNFSCYIENHIGIISYDDGCIKINTKTASTGGMVLYFLKLKVSFRSSIVRF